MNDNGNDGNGGRSDGDSQPDDTGAQPGPAKDKPATGERQAQRNRENDPAEPGPLYWGQSSSSSEASGASPSAS